MMEKSGQISTQKPHCPYRWLSDQAAHQTA
jgi:hypothetical protein